MNLQTLVILSILALLNPELNAQMDIDETIHQVDPTQINDEPGDMLIPEPDQEFMVEMDDFLKPQIHHALNHFQVNFSKFITDFLNMDDSDEMDTFSKVQKAMPQAFDKSFNALKEFYTNISRLQMVGNSQIESIHTPPDVYHLFWLEFKQNSHQFLDEAQIRKLTDEMHKRIVAKAKSRTLLLFSTINNHIPSIKSQRTYVLEKINTYHETYKLSDESSDIPDFSEKLQTTLLEVYNESQKAEFLRISKYLNIVKSQFFMDTF